MVEWGQVISGTPQMSIEDDPVEQFEISQNNHDLVVLTSENYFGDKLVHEDLDGTVIRDDHENENGQNIQAAYDNIPYENQGAEYESESVYDIVPDHEHDDSSDIQEYVNNRDEQDDGHVAEANVDDEDVIEQEPLNE